MSTEPNQPMGKFVTRYLSSQVKSTNWSNPWTSIHMGTIQPRRRTQRKSKEGYLCAVFVCVVWEVHRPTIADNGDPVAVSLCGLHRPATSAYSKEIPGKLLACCVSVWNASARRSRIILKGTWLTAQTVIGELSGLFIGIRAPRGYLDCLKTVPAVSVSNSYQRIFGYSNYPPRLTAHVVPFNTAVVIVWKRTCELNTALIVYRGVVIAQLLQPPNSRKNKHVQSFKKWTVVACFPFRLISPIVNSSAET